MRFSIAYQPSYSLAIVDLDPGEEIRCEPGAMVSMSSDLSLEVGLNSGSGGGGLMGAAFGAMKKKFLGGESLFVTKIKAAGKGGEVTLAPAAPGDITAIELTGKSYILQAGGFLACGTGVDIDTKMSFGGMVGGEGLFFLRVGGKGTLLCTCFGALHKRELKPNEKYVVDSGHIVAYEEGMGMITKLASSQGGGGWFNPMKAATAAASGEGIVMEFTGPGVIYMQTRNPDAFSTWMAKLLPAPSNQSGGGALGSLIGGGSD